MTTAVILPPMIPSEAPIRGRVVEVKPPRSESFTIGAVDEYARTIGDVRCMITMAIGTLKEVKAQARAIPGARFLIGEILCCLGNAQKVMSIDPKKLQFKTL